MIDSLIFVREALKKKVIGKTRKGRQIIAGETPWHAAMASRTVVYSARSMIPFPWSVGLWSFTLTVASSNRSPGFTFDQECRQSNFCYRQAQQMVEVRFCRLRISACFLQFCCDHLNLSGECRRAQRTTAEMILWPFHSVMQTRKHRAQSTEQADDQTNCENWTALNKIKSFCDIIKLSWLFVNCLLLYSRRVILKGVILCVLR